MKAIQMNDLIARMQDLQAQAQAQTGAMTALPGLAGEGKQADFASELARSIGQVNELQRGAEQLAARFERGDRDVDLVTVMVAGQKASLSFKAMVEVRNQVVRAYRDIMNMAI